jgi:hypothetical protein
LTTRSWFWRQIDWNGSAAADFKNGRSAIGAQAPSNKRRAEVGFPPNSTVPFTLSRRAALGLAPRRDDRRRLYAAPTAILKSALTTSADGAGRRAIARLRERHTVFPRDCEPGFDRLLDFRQRLDRGVAEGRS